MYTMGGGDAADFQSLLHQTQDLVSQVSTLHRPIGTPCCWQPLFVTPKLE